MEWKTWFMIFVILLAGLVIVGGITQQSWVLNQSLNPAITLGLLGALLIQFAIPVRKRDER